MGVKSHRTLNVSRTGPLLCNRGKAKPSGTQEPEREISAYSDEQQAVHAATATVSMRFNCWGVVDFAIVT
jgi:hypothetical protein